MVDLHGRLLATIHGVSTLWKRRKNPEINKSNCNFRVFRGLNPLTGTWFTFPAHMLSHQRVHQVEPEMLESHMFGQLRPSFHVDFQLLLYCIRHGPVNMLICQWLSILVWTLFVAQSGCKINFDVYMRDHSTSKSSSSVSTQKHLRTCSVIHFSCLFLAFDKSCSNRKADGKFENFCWENWSWQDPNKIQGGSPPSPVFLMQWTIPHKWPVQVNLGLTGVSVTTYDSGVITWPCWKNWENPGPNPRIIRWLKLVSEKLKAPMVTPLKVCLEGCL